MSRGKERRLSCENYVYVWLIKHNVETTTEWENSLPRRYIYLEFIDSSLIRMRKMAFLFVKMDSKG